MGLKDAPFDSAIHQAKIEIDGEGAEEATGVTGKVIYKLLGTLVIKPDPIYFHCDHPFIFMINDRVSHEVLFAGVYRGPAAAAQ